MAVKKVLLKIRVFTNNCQLIECLFPIFLRDKLNMHDLKGSLLGKKIEGYYYTDKGEQFTVFGMIEHIFCVVNIEERKRCKPCLMKH